MSELAERDRAVKRGWAAPGASHDRLVTAMKIGLPALIGIVLAFLVFAPLEDKQEVSFLLKKDEVERTEERMTVRSAQYRGLDNRGRPFVLNARQALQQNARSVVDIADMNAEMQLESGAARIQAGRARYDMNAERVDVVGPVLLSRADGYQLHTRDVAVNLRERRLTSAGSVEGSMPLGNFSAGGLEANLGDRTVTLSGRARLHIVQGGIR